VACTATHSLLRQGPLGAKTRERFSSSICLSRRPTVYILLFKLEGRVPTWLKGYEIPAACVCSLAQAISSLGEIPEERTLTAGRRGQPTGKKKVTFIFLASALGKTVRSLRSMRFQKPACERHPIQHHLEKIYLIGRASH